MTCHDICIAFMHGTSSRVGCECMVGVDTVFGVRPFDHGKSTLCLVFDGGPGILDHIQWSLTGAYKMFLNKTFIRDYPLFLNKTVY